MVGTCANYGPPRGPPIQSDCLNETLSQLQSQLKKVNRRFAQRRRELEAEQGESGLVIGSNSMKTLLDQARRVATVDTSVLLQASRARANASPATSTTRPGPRPGPSWRSTARRCPSR